MGCNNYHIPLSVHHLISKRFLYQLIKITPIISFLKSAFYTNLIQKFWFKKPNQHLIANRVRLIRFNKDTDSVSLKIPELWSRVLDWLPEYKQVDRGPVMLYYSQFASGWRLFVLCYRLHHLMFHGVDWSTYNKNYIPFLVFRVLTQSYKRKSNWICEFKYEVPELSVNKTFLTSWKAIVLSSLSSKWCNMQSRIWGISVCWTSSINWAWLRKCSTSRWARISAAKSFIGIFYKGLNIHQVNKFSTSGFEYLSC